MQEPKPLTTTKFLTKVVAFYKYPMGKPVMKALKDGDRLELRREPTNQFDPNAIQIIGKNPEGQDVQLGYVPAEMAANLRGRRLVAAYKHYMAWDAILVETEDK